MKKILSFIILVLSIFLLSNNVKAMTESEFNSLSSNQMYIVGSYMFDIGTYNPTIQDLMTAAKTIQGDEIEIIEVFKIGNVLQASKVFKQTQIDKSSLLNNYVSNVSRLYKTENGTKKYDEYETTILMYATYSNELQMDTFEWNDLGSGTYSYSITGTNAHYFNISGSSLLILASTPIGTYDLKVTATDKANYERKAANFRVVINKATLIFNNVTIGGINSVGQTLTANVTNEDATINYTYRWYTNTTNATTGGVLIAGGNQKTLKLTNNELGKYIYVVVTANKNNYFDTTKTALTNTSNNYYDKVEENVLPIVSLNKESDATLLKSHSINVRVTGMLELAQNQGIKYGFSTSNEIAPTTYVNADLTYSIDNKTITFTATSANELTGDYYLWVAPNISICDIANNCITDIKISTGTFAFDNDKPIILSSILSDDKFTIDAKDALSGVEMYFYGYKEYVDGLTCNDITKYVSSTSSSYEFAFDNDKEYIICGYVTDKAGNRSNTTNKYKYISLASDWRTISELTNDNIIVLDMQTSLISTDTYTYRDNIYSKIGMVDVSSNKSGSILLSKYALDGQTTKIVVISSNGKIKLPDDSSLLFNNFKNMEYINLSNVDTSRVINMSYMLDSVGYNVTTWNIEGISDWDTSNVTNMSYMFSGAGYNATAFSLNLSSWDTSNVTNMSKMFDSVGYNATTWSIGDISSWDTSSVTNMRSMFASAGYYAITFALNLSGWDTSNVTDMSGMFDSVGYNATAFSLNLSSWDTSNVTNMSSMFDSAGYNATTWSIGDISGWDTSSVTDMSSMFSYVGYNATTWSIGDLSSWDTSKVTDMRYMFSNAGYKATTFSLNLSNWDVSSLTSMEQMFYESGYNATTWSIGDISEWDTSIVTDMGSMFNSAGYNAITWSIGDISGWDTSKVTTMSFMFESAGRSATTWSIGDISGWNTSCVTNMSGMFAFAGYNAATWSIGELSSWATSKVTNMSKMFNSAGYKVTTWSIGDLSSWDTSNVKYMISMFDSAGYNATTWNIGDISLWDTSSVTDMRKMFSGARYSATSFNLNLSDWDTSNVTDMGGMFYEAGYNATTFSLNLSDWDTSNVKGMSSMFESAGYNAPTWSIGDISLWDTSNVKGMSSMFESAGYKVTTWSIGDLSSWDTSNVTNMSSMFDSAGYNATTWSIGDISDWDTSKVTDMSKMFRLAGYNVTIFTLNLSSWDTSSVTDMSSMFSHAGLNATTWSIGDLSGWDTSKVTDMSEMFRSAWYKGTIFTLNLSSWDTSNVKNMSYMFFGTGYNATTWSIEDLSYWDTSSVTNMSYMFYYAGYNATTFTLNLSDWNTSKVTNMDRMFALVGYNATTWSIRGLSSWDTSNATDMSSMFYYAGYNATTWSIGGLSSWDTSNVKNMSNMFDHAGYNSTTFTLNLSDWNTSKVTNMDRMFALVGYNATTCIVNLSGFNFGASNSVLSSYNYMFINTSSNAKIIVGSTTAQNWILTASNYRPTSWTISNVIVSSLKVIFDRDTNTTISKSHTINVYLLDAVGFKENIQFKYGWSTSNIEAPTEYENVNLTNKVGEKQIVTSIVEDKITGQNYLWIVPVSVCNTADECKSLNTISTGTFYFDNTGPIITESTLVGKKVTLTANDDHSGIDKYYYGYKEYVNGATCDDVVFEESDNSYKEFELIAGNEYLLCSYVIDKLGNKSVYDRQYVIKTLASNWKTLAGLTTEDSLNNIIVVDTQKTMTTSDTYTYKEIIYEKLETIDVSSDSSNTIQLSKYSEDGVNTKIIIISSNGLIKLPVDSNSLFIGLQYTEMINLENVYATYVTNMSNMFKMVGYKAIELLMDISGFELGPTNFDLKTFATMFNNNPEFTTIKVKNEAAQNWILTAENGRLPSWTTNNVTIKN